MLKTSLKRLVLPALAILAAFLVYLYQRPVPAVKPVNEIITVPKPQLVSLPWPSTGQAALGASGYGLLEAHNTSIKVPIGSVAKVITALAVLKQKPIMLGSQGATITLTSNDVDIFNGYYLKDGSVTQVTAGEKISEYQALQEMLLPSSNNMADTLAGWAFGSINAYVAYANQMVKQMGLINTKVGDTNGFSDTTSSTASDLVLLGIQAMKNPVIAQVVGQSSAQVPVAGTIQNINALLGSDGVVGVKTGFTDRAGGCYLFATQRNILGHNLTLVGAILDQPRLSDAFRAAQLLINASDKGFENVSILHKSQTLGYYPAPWGQTVQAKAANNVPLLIWKGKMVKVINNLQAITINLNTESKIGRVTVQNGDQSASSSLLLNQQLSKPSWHWKIFRK